MNLAAILFRVQKMTPEAATDALWALLKLQDLNQSVCLKTSLREDLFNISIIGVYLPCHMPGAVALKMIR